MSRESSVLTPEERDELDLTVLVRKQLEEQYPTLEHQQETAALGMWVFLATEVMFFGTLFTGLGVYRSVYPIAFETASTKLNWIIGGTNTIVLLCSSLTMVLAVYSAKLGLQRRVVLFLSLTALLGGVFLVLKGFEYYLDYQQNLIPGWKFNANEWVTGDGLTADQVPHVKLFLSFYWIMTVTHAVHMIIGMTAVLVMIALTKKGIFSATYYAPIDVTGLYWHFVDMVWIFLLPMLYLLGSHSSPF